ncbi:hypothetical protein Tco_1064103, partial [Tanacetum coccineum]
MFREVVQKIDERLGWIRNNIGAETDTMRPQVHDGGSGAVAMDEGQGAAKGMSVKEYLGKTLKPDDEDKALSNENQHTS